MRVNIGPYKNWFGPFQIAQAILFWLPRGSDRVHKLGDWLAYDRDDNDSWLLKFCSKVAKIRKRKIRVELDPYDHWNVDDTLAHIIAPLLVELKKHKHGAPHVDDEDVPEELRSTSAPKPETEWDLDANHFKRYDWLLDELIWAFTTHIDPEDASEFYDHSSVDKSKPLSKQIQQIKVDREGLDAHLRRKQRAFELFGKYYTTLWD